MNIKMILFFIVKIVKICEYVKIEIQHCRSQYMSRLPVMMFPGKSEEGLTFIFSFSQICFLRSPTDIWSPSKTNVLYSNVALNL